MKLVEWKNGYYPVVEEQQLRSPQMKLVSYSKGQIRDNDSIRIEVDGSLDCNMRAEKGIIKKEVIKYPTSNYYQTIVTLKKNEIKFTSLNSS